MFVLIPRRKLMATTDVAHGARTAEPHSSPKTSKTFTDGEWAASKSGKTFNNVNPADTREVVGVFQRSNADDVNAAVDAASRAFQKWRLVPAPRRAEMLYEASRILEKKKEAFSR